MSRVLMVGASHEMLTLARELGHEPVAVVDSGLVAGAKWQGLPAFSSDQVALDAGGFDAFVAAIDAPSARKRVHELYGRAGVRPMDLVHGYKAASVRSGPGLVVTRFAHLSEDCVVGEGARLNVLANVMHDVTLGDFVTVAPNAVLLSRVRVGSLAYVGANAVLMVGITVGAGSVIGAGSIVTHDVPDGATVKGNPAR